MSAVLAVLHEAGTSANNRGTVQKDFFAIRNRASVLGTYSINVNGDTSLAPFVISRVKSGQLVPVPVRVRAGVTATRPAARRAACWCGCCWR